MVRPGRLAEVGRLVGFSVAFVLLAGLILGRSSSAVLPQGAGTLLAVVVVSVVFLRIEGQSLRVLGLGREGSGGEVIRGVLLGVLFALLALLLAAVPGGLRWIADDGTVLEYVATGGWTLFILLFPAAAEEILFRGYPMRVLQRAWGPGVALIVTSVAFAVLHGGNPEVGPLAIVNIGLAGLLLGVVYLQTGSLWWATGVHLGWNFASSFIGDLPLSGLNLVDSPLLDVGSQGRELITGGPFGLEGGLAGTLALGVAVAVLFRKPVLSASAPALAGGSRAPLSRIIDLQWPLDPAGPPSEGGSERDLGADDT
ncbi:MAG: CPBP family intramembrane glutamic endopeptidase [Longimicrobiales bacterium]